MSEKGGMRSKIKILHIIDSLSQHSGGGQIAAVSWVEELSKNPDVSVMLLTNNEYRHHNSNVIHLSLPSFKLPGHKPEFPMSFWVPNSVKKQILDFKPDVIHLHDPQLLSPYFLYFARTHKIPVFSSFLTNFLWCAENFDFPHNLIMKGVSLLQDFIFKHSTTVIVPTKFWQKKYQAHIDKSFFTVPLSVNSVFFDYQPLALGENQAPFKLISVSRLSPEKRLDKLLKMMTYLDPRFKLTIVGTGAEASKLKRQRDELGLAKRVDLVGWKNHQEQVSLYHQHHLTISISSFETFGLTYIESLATGTPGLVFDYPVSREVIPNNAATFVNSDQPEFLAQRVTNIFNSGSYQKMVVTIESSYKQLQNHLPHQSADTLLDAYKHLLSQPRKKSDYSH